MTPDHAMTGTFKTNLPADLLTAIERHSVSEAEVDLTVRSMKPSLVERMLGLFSRKPAPRRR
jgi:hypothetical protein